MAAFTLPTTFGTIDHAPTAAEMLQIINALQSTINGLTDFSGSLVIGASVTPPTKGNSTYVAAYVQRGQMVLFTGKVTIGSTFSAGSGTYTLNLPVTASANAVSNIMPGSMLVNDAGTSIHSGTMALASTTTVNIYSDGVTSGSLGSAGPGTVWNTGDHFEWAIEYEAA